MPRLVAEEAADEMIEIAADPDPGTVDVDLALVHALALGIAETVVIAAIGAEGIRPPGVAVPPNPVTTGGSLGVRLRIVRALDPRISPNPALSLDPAQRANDFSRHFFSLETFSPF